VVYVVPFQGGYPEASVRLRVQAVAIVSGNGLDLELLVTVIRGRAVHFWMLCADLLAPESICPKGAIKSGDMHQAGLEVDLIALNSDLCGCPRRAFYGPLQLDGIEPV
jgi:hypothetical protein